ncbi:MAG: Zn-ribbon domain-containing OB-fold protein [Promethearchaeota archaeon]
MVEKHIEITEGFVQAEFNFWVGKYMDKFYDALEASKILGNKCQTCGKVYLPPRKICGECFKTINFETQWVELIDTGTLLNFSLAHYVVSEGGKTKTKDPVLIGMVKIDGSDTAVIYKILEAEEKDLKIGLKMQVVWNDKLQGHPTDIKGFKPIGGI